MTGDDDDERTVFQPKDGGGSGGFAPLGGSPPPPPPAPPPPPSPAVPANDPFLPVPPPKPSGGPSGDGQIAVGDVLIGTYRITRLIGRGGMGEVYEGVNIHSAGERVAVKVMLSHLASDELVMAMFAKEASMLTRLHHEAIVPYRNTSRDPHGRPFIVTEFVDGPSLEQRLGSVRLSDAQFGELARRLALGLGAAHALGAIHRDIAPDNILLVDGDPLRPKIIDFGIARDARDQQQQHGTIVGDGFAGKLKYVAPEQLGEYGRRIGPWTDLYSLALTLLAVASGEHSKMGGSIADAVRKRMSVPDISAIPARYRPAFERALQPDPAQRPQSMGDFIALLQQADGAPAGGFAPLDERPRAPASTSARANGPGLAGRLIALPGAFAAKLPTGLPGGKWTALGGAGALLLILGIIGIVIATGGDDGPPPERRAAREETGPAEVVTPGSQAFAMLASSLAAEPPCSWLSFDGADADTARFVGGAGNPAAAQSAIADGLTAKGADSATLDMGDVAAFNPAMCGAVDALREFRSPDDLITSPQRTYEVENQAIVLDGVLWDEGPYAKPLVKISGLRPDDDLAVLVIDATNGIGPLFTGRENAKLVAQRLSGTLGPDGFDMAYPAELTDPPKESYGIAVIAGRGPFPTNIFGDPNVDGSKAALDPAWPDRFRAEARAKGWRTDIFWFSVADDVPG